MSVSGGAGGESGGSVWGTEKVEKGKRGNWVRAEAEKTSSSVSAPN